MPHTRPVTFLLLALAGCSGGGGVTLADSDLAANPQPVERLSALLATIPRAGGPPTYLHISSLEPVEGIVTPTLPPLEQVWGIDRVSGVLIGVNEEGNALSIDLETGRSRTVAQDVAKGVLTFAGVAYAVSHDLTVTGYRERGRQTWTYSASEMPTLLLARRNGRPLFVLPGDPPTLVMPGRTEDDPPATSALESTNVTGTLYADHVLAVGAGGITLFHPGTKTPPKTIDFRVPPRHAVFSPSGHQILALADSAKVTIVDQFSGRVSGAIPLPGTGSGLRTDPLGQWLLVRVDSANAVWLVDPVARSVAGAAPSDWNEAFPAISPDGLLVTQLGDTVISLELETLDELARYVPEAPVHWTLTTRSPPRRVTIAEDLGERTEDADTTGGSQWYIQVASSQNPDWANDLASSLAGDAGLPALVLDPIDYADSYKVVIGPYRSRDEADAAAAQLGRPYFLREQIGVGPDDLFR